MPNPLDDALPELLEILNLEERGDNAFQGQPQNTGNGRIFGGLVFSQAMRAAIATVDDRAPHSAHAYFLRPGDPTKPIEYEVDRIRDGRSFTTRRVLAHQGADPIFNLSLSFHAGEQSAHHQISADLPAEPSGLTHETGIRRAMTAMGIDPPESAVFFGAFEILSEDGIEMVGTPKSEARTQTWMRARGEVPDGMAWSAPLLAFVSDFCIMLPAFRPIEYGPMTPGAQTASLDHAIWFHQPFKIDEWLLAVQDSPILSGGRGLGRMLFYARDGRLVASAVQEALFRDPRPDNA